MRDRHPAGPADAIGAILFDLDGTLADTAGDLAGALNRVRAEHGLPALPLATLRPHASAGARGLLGAGMGVAPDHVDFDSLRASFLGHYEACLAETTRLFDGVAELLDALDLRGVRWGVVTNKATRFTQPVVAALSLEGRAATIVAGDTTPNPKPHPDPLLHAARELGLAPARCAYVGDDLRDVLAGNAAGMATLVANWGYLGAGSDPAQWPARAWLADPRDILAWLDRRDR